MCRMTKGKEVEWSVLNQTLTEIDSRFVRALWKDNGDSLPCWVNKQWDYFGQLRMNARPWVANLKMIR